MDAVVAWGGANFHYLSGFQNYFDNPGASIAVLPIRPDAAPFMIVADWVIEAARSASWIEEAHAFPLWLEIFERSQLKIGRAPVERPLRYDLAANIDLLSRLLHERGLGLARIGVEQGAISAAAFEMLRSALPAADWIEASGVFFELRSLKHPEEVRLIERATEYAEHGLRALASSDLEGADVPRLRALYEKACVDHAL